ncbi:P-loop containing nucleoside triphosphate hydrolase protein [Pluteus cervinus]|uniref:P-loop containing nucleoside triphosphate hydrolase protein n=1 Tax=Pluteus cervinus TaxID=181527 RepID=A0ACD3APV4_9AGAR|nr:P-loop containing nucleoside triphosphate hydrolase protein [Pluteus cervinus]
MNSSTQQRKRKASKPPTVKFGTAPPGDYPAKRFDPFTAFADVKAPGPSTAPASTSTSRNASKPKSRAKGPAPKARPKGKGKEHHRLWVDIYEPTTEAELAVHVKKVEDIRRWLLEAFEGGPSKKLVKYRRVLALTGPAGAGKTATLKILAKDLDFEILEWRSSMAENYSSSSAFGGADIMEGGSWGEDMPAYESMFTKFRIFLQRAISCQNVFGPASSIPRSSESSKAKPSRHIILLEDLPNVLHAQTQAQFHEVLQSLVASPPSSPPVPVILIVSDAGLRGEAGDEGMMMGGGQKWGRSRGGRASNSADGKTGGWGGESDGVVDIRTVLPKAMLTGPFVTQISFNPVAPTLMQRALQSILTRHVKASGTALTISQTRDLVSAVVDSSSGDIRSAVMSLQFACAKRPTDGPTKGKKAKSADKDAAMTLLGVMAKREQSLALFHLLGKVLYNKRKGDPPSISLTARDKQKEQELDASLPNQPPLPFYFKDHERRPSRVNVDTLYADSPIDSSLFSLYVHQNYPQFCNELEEIESVGEWLSWVDSSGGEAWYQSTPHQFYVLTLGTLHSLPSPVERRSQNIGKPEWFDKWKKEKDAWDGVRDVQNWLQLGWDKASSSRIRQDQDDVAGVELSRHWNRTEIALELGGILKAYDNNAAFSQTDSVSFRPPPHSHKLFSRMAFVRDQKGHGAAGGTRNHTNEEDLAVEPLEGDEEAYDVAAAGAFDHAKVEAQSGGWLLNDEIEEF